MWQKNHVFSPDVIQPLLDLANPNTQIETGRFPTRHSPSNLDPQANSSSSAAAAANAVISLANNLNTKEKSLITELKQLASSLHLLKGEDAKFLEQTVQQQQANFADIGYNNGHSDDDQSGTPTEAEPPYTKSNNVKDIDSISSFVTKIFNNNDQQFSGESWRESSQSAKNLEDFVQKLITKPNLDQQEDGSNQFSVDDSPHRIKIKVKSDLYGQSSAESYGINELASDSQLSPQRESFSEENTAEIEQVQLQSQEYYSDRTRSRRSRSRSDSLEHRNRYSRHGRSKSRSRSPDEERKKRKHRRSRSRSSSPYSVERARARDRRRKGYPTNRKNCVTICSTTLWIGHIPKFASESDLSDVFGEYGVINSIDVRCSKLCCAKTN